MHNDPQDDKKPKHLLDLTLRGLPELEEFDNDAQRQAALREIGQEAADLKSGGYWLGVAVLVGSTVISWWTVRWVLARISWPQWIEGLIQLLAFGGTFWLVIRWLHRSGARAELRQKLLQQGIPVCLKCGYLLRGLPPETQRCPECGQAIEKTALELVWRQAPPSAPPES